MKELTPAEWRHLLYLFVAGEEEMRLALTKPFEQYGYVCATNSRIILRVSKKFISEDFSTDRRVPYVADGLPRHNPVAGITIDAFRNEFVRQKMCYDVTTAECPYCNDEYEVKWEHTDIDGDRHEMWAECPICKGTGSIPNGMNKKCQVLCTTFNVHYMLLIYHVMLALDVDKVEVTPSSKGGPFLFHIADGVDVAAMPCIS